MTKKAQSPDLLTLLGQAVDTLVLFFCGLYLAARPLIPGEAAGLGTNAVLLVFVATALLLWVMRSVVEGGFVLTLSGLEIPAVAWLALGLFSLSAAADVYHGSLRVGFWAGDLAMLWLVLQYGRTSRGGQLLLRIVLASAVVAALNGLYQYPGPGFDAMRDQAKKEVLETLPDEMRTVFLMRLHSNRIFSTFILANAFGGYLILLLPVLVALLIESRSAFWRITHGLFVGVLACALLLTGSKGSFLALGLAVAIGLALRWRRLMKRPRTVIAVGALAGVALLGYILLLAEVGPLGPVRKKLGDALPSPASLAGSAEVREGYWSATMGIIGDHPLRGVGVDNWTGYYHQYRAADAGESKRAHNNYLQIAAEMGLPGLLVFAAIWIVWGLRVRRDATAEAQPAPADPLLEGVLRYHALLFFVIGVATFGFLFAMNTSFDAPEGPPGRDGEPFDYRPAMYIAYGLIWLLAGALIRPATSRLVRWGIAVGVGAFLIHGLVDFDLYVKGLSATAFTMVGLGLAMAAGHAGTAPKVVKLPLPLQFVIAIACLPPFYLLSNSWLLNTIRAEAKREEAAEHRAKKRPGLAIERLREAAELIPWDFRTHHELARIELDTLTNVTSYSALAGAGEQAKDRAMAHLDAAVRHNAQHATLYFDRGRGLEHYGRVSRRSQRQFETGTKLHTQLGQNAEAALRAAREAYQAAVRRYPTKPEFQLRLGRLLRFLGERDAALEAYQEARRCHDARDVGDPIQLDDEQLAEIDAALKQ